MATGAARQRTLTLRQARSNGGGRPATRALGLGLLIGALALCGCTSAPGPGRAGLSRIDHIVVIYAENRSFDHLYGLFPGADGIANATPAQYTQLDHDGTPLTQLPPVWTADGKPDTRFPTTLPNRPFRIDAPPVSKGLDQIVPSPIHQFWQNQEQIAGGANNKFVAMTTVGSCSPCFMFGTTSVPPARIFAFDPCCAKSATASSTVSGVSSWNGSMRSTTSTHSE